MTCRELTEFIADYLDGGLDPHARVRFERHLDACPNCQKYLARYRQAVTLGRRAFDDDGAARSVDVPEELIRAILHARRCVG